MFIFVSVFYKLIPIYIYLSICLITPFAMACSPLKRIDFLKFYDLRKIIQAYLKKRILKKTVVQLNITSAFGGLYSIQNLYYFKNNKKFFNRIISDRLKKWEDK